MLQRVQKIIRKAFIMIEVALRMARGTDYKILSEYVLNINKLRKIEDILAEVAKCFRLILNYEFIGFALRKGESVTAWLDPASYEDAFLEVLRKDFPGQKIDGMFRFLDRPGDAPSVKGLPLSGLVACASEDAGFPARLYVLPRRSLLLHHRHVLNVIVRTAACALRNAMTIESLQSLAAIDPLTDCYNRSALAGYLEHGVATAKRYGNDLSLIIFDLDRFKDVNDRYGHQAGDAVLKETARTVLSAIRKSDCLARYGGDEFILLLPNTNLFVAAALAERLRKEIAGLTIDAAGTSFGITASFGVAALRDGADGEAMLREADEMLYRSKARGRNRVTPHARAGRVERPADAALAR